MPAQRTAGQAAKRLNVPRVRIMPLHRLGWALAAALLAACGGGHENQPSLARVKVQRVEPTRFAPQVTFTGSVQARVQTELSFRVGGKLIERHVEVGQRVSAGQLLARLDPQAQRNNLASAEAVLAAEQARLRQVAADFHRQARLLPKGYTSRSEYDQAEAAWRSAKSALQAAEAQRANARDQLAHTELRSSADGVITSRQAEVGQVVQAAAPVFGLAGEGGRDAVFHVYEGVLNQTVELPESIEVVLLDDPRVRSRARIREVTPTVAERSGTVQVKVALVDAPPGMQLGAVVTASYASAGRLNVVLPAAALSSLEGQAAVWLLDEHDRVRLNPVRVARYGDGRMVIDSGLEVGQRVVVAGGQLLYPGQAVEIAESLEDATGLVP